MLLTVVDGEARLYRVAFEPSSQRDEPVIAARNREFLDAALAYLKTRTFFGVAFWDLAAYLLNIGLYKSPVAPDPLETIWERALAEAGIKRYHSEWSSPRMDASEIQQLLHHQQENALAPDTPPLPANAVYQLKISLEGSRPPIWRRVLVPGEFTLADLHHVVQIVMGWESYHMHRFEAGGVNYGEPDPNLEFVNDAAVTLLQLFKRPKFKFRYEYDFGDSWRHTLVVEKIMEPQAGEEYPMCLAGKQACPPEDVGGVWGYYSFLEAMDDARHPEHKRMREWYGRKFDPDKFDLDAVNRKLAQLR